MDNKNSTLLFILLLAVFAVHIGRHVNDFYVPESDFFDFRDKAIALRNLEWPDNFKRPPLYSALIAAVSTVIPGHNRELYAAEIIGFLAALAALCLFYKIARHFFGDSAIFLAWAWAFHPSTIRMAVKPKSEILVTLLVLWSFYLFIKDKKPAYFLGFLASMVRYEGALMIAAAGGADLLLRKDKLKTIGYSLAAGFTIVLWTVWQATGGDSESYFSYFNEYHLNIAFFKTFWDGLVGFLPYQAAKLWILATIFLFTSGIAFGFQKFRRETIGMNIFLIGFLVMHVIWPMPNFDYQIIMVWNALLLIGLGLTWLLGFVRSAIPAKTVAHPFWAGGGATIFSALLLILLLAPAPFPQSQVHWGMMLLFFAPVAAALLRFYRGRIKGKVSVLLGLATVFLGLLYFMSSNTNALMYNIRYSKAEFSEVGEWFAQQTNGEKLAVEQPVIVGYYSGKTGESFARLTDLKKTTPHELHAWLRDNGITHIAWMSANKIFDTDNAWYQWKMDNRGWKNIEFLAAGKDTAGFTLVKEIKIGPRWAYIYKI